MLRGNGELTILNRLRFKFELYGWPLWTGSYPNFPHCRSAPEQLIDPPTTLWTRSRVQRSGLDAAVGCRLGVKLAVVNSTGLAEHCGTATFSSTGVRLARGVPTPFLMAETLLLFTYQRRIRRDVQEIWAVWYGGCSGGIGNDRAQHTEPPSPHLG